MLKKFAYMELWCVKVDVEEGDKYLEDSQRKETNCLEIGFWENFNY